jgi:hypothetical protein
VVVGVDLAEEQRQGDQGAEQAVNGLADLGGDDLGDPVGGEDPSESQPGIKDQSAEEGSELITGRGVVRIEHDRPSLAVESGQIPSIDAKAGLSCICQFRQRTYGSVSAIQL